MVPQKTAYDLVKVLPTKKKTAKHGQVRIAMG
jgi:hypothetical protein